MRRVERTAWNAIVRCTRAQKLSTIPLPIPVEQWIEGPLGISFGIADLGPGVLGIARPTEREILVSQALADQEARFRFTAAHELGHILLHPRITAEFRESADGDFVDRKIEREADRFAAAFLMPLPALTFEFSRITGQNSTEPNGLLSAARRADAAALQLFRTVVLPHMTRRFGVSLSAAARRFADVQLPTGEPALPWEVCAMLLPPEQVREALRRG
jgi:hypothetical protein